jgi:hypothetical protein
VLSGASGTCHRGLACPKCLFDNQAASRARGPRVPPPWGATPLAPVGLVPAGNAWVPRGAPRAGSGGKLQEGRGSGDGSPDRFTQQGPEAQATPRLSRGAVKPKCGREGRRKRWPWRSGESPEEAESQESIGLSAGRQPRGVRTHRAEEDSAAAENHDLPDTSEWRTAVSRNGMRVTAPRGARLPEEEQGSVGRTPGAAPA